MLVAAYVGTGGARFPRATSTVEVRLDESGAVPTSWQVIRAENGNAPILVDFTLSR